MVFCALLLPLTAATGWAAESDDGLTVHPEVLHIGTFYSGGDIRISGQAPTEGDVIVEITGPKAAGLFDVKGRVGPFWMTRDKAAIEGAPSAYALLLPGGQDWGQKASALGLGFENLRKAVSIDSDLLSADEAFNMFLKLKKDEDLYVVKDNAVRYSSAKNGGRVFEATYRFPRSTVKGDYHIKATAIVNGEEKGAVRSRGFKVYEVGFTSLVDDLATNRRLTCGILAVCIALVTGAVMGLLFKGGGSRKRPSLPFNDLFVRFHQVLEENTKAMEIISEMEDKPITGNRYSEIHEAIASILHQLKQELSGYPVFPQVQNVVGLSEINDTLGDAVGNKAHKLSMILQLPQTAVPPGIVVTVMGFRSYLAYNDLFDSITELLGSLEKGGRELETVSSKIQLLILGGGGIPPDLRQEILKGVETICPRSFESGFFSIRSSAVGEDGVLSFAGLHDSFLNIPFRDCLSGYKRGLAGMYNPAALEYRLNRQIPFSDMAMAVLYQKMVPGQVSGVMYSIDPNAPQENVCLVTAAQGPGKGVVEGSTAADTFRLSRDPPYLQNTLPL